MGLRRFDSCRDNPLLGVMLSAASGIMLAFGMLAAKIALGSHGIAAALLNPVAIVAVVLALAGFLTMQVSFRVWHLSSVTIMITGTVVLASNILGFFILLEAVSTLKWLALAVILAGISLMLISARK